MANDFTSWHMKLFAESMESISAYRYLPYVYVPVYVYMRLRVCTNKLAVQYAKADRSPCKPVSTSMHMRL